MIQGLYICHSSYDKKNNTGIYKKIKSQIEMFNRMGILCEEYIQKSGRENKTDIIGKIVHRLPFSNTVPKWEYDKIFENIDYIYMRRPRVINLAMRRVLYKIKKNNPHIKIIMELPTYPYDHEFKRIWDYSLLRIDQYNRKRLKGFVDCLTVISGEKKIDSIWNIKTIPFINGYDVNKITPKHTAKNQDGAIHLICVACFSEWHGYERLISGLADYYKNGGYTNFVIDMVGEGPELKKYKNLSEKKELENKVVFWGKVLGKELDQLYDMADFAVTGLGWYKEGFNVVGDLKSREYMAKGIPIISGSPVDVFQQKPFRYICEFPNNSQKIDFQIIDQFYHKIYDGIETRDKIARNIRNYAIESVSMDVVMKDIVNYIKDAGEGR